MTLHCENRNVKVGSVGTSETQSRVLFSSLSPAAKKLAGKELVDELNAIGPSSERWPDIDTFHKRYPALLLNLLIRYDASFVILKKLSKELFRRFQEHDQRYERKYTERACLCKEMEAELARPDRKPGELAAKVRQFDSLTSELKFLDRELAFFDSLSQILAEDFPSQLAGHRDRGAALRAINARVQLDSDFEQFGRERLIPPPAPPSPEELAYRKAQHKAAAAAQGVVQYVDEACRRLKLGKGLQRRRGCGCGNAHASQHIKRPGDILFHQIWCGMIGCPKCEAYHRARRILTMMQAVLRQIPDGGVLAPHDQKKPLNLPWRTGTVCVIECSTDDWESKIRKRINRSAQHKDMPVRLPKLIGILPTDPGKKIKLIKEEKGSFGTGYGRARKNGRVLVATEAPKKFLLGKRKDTPEPCVTFTEMTAPEAALRLVVQRGLPDP